MSLKSRVMLSIVLFAAVVATLAVLGPIDTVWAQDQDAPANLEELKDERERIAREAALAARDIDVVTASVDEVTAALDELAAFVEIQQIRLDEAEGKYENALALVDNARVEREEILRTADLLRDHLADLAVASFTGEAGTAGDEVTELVLSDDPGESARFLHLLELQTGSLGDGLDQLRALDVEAEALIVEQQEAALRAEGALSEVEARTEELVAAQAQQELVVAAAELRLEAQLAEAAFLEERDLELATAIRDEQAAISNRIASIARSRGIVIPDPVNLDDIELISFYRPEDQLEATIDPETGVELPAVLAADAEPFFQIEVHKDIAAQTRRLYQTAFDQGINLGGWGYRPIQRQVELRTINGCPDVYTASPSSCRVPTARPGFSKHEQGRAIDFQWNGGGIGSRSSAAFQWLQTHAPQYGFVNLPSEPWHWSIDEGQERLPG